MSEICGAHKCVGLAAVLNDKLIFKSHIMLADNDCGTVLGGGLCKLVSVGRYTVYTHKGIALIDLSRILFDVGYLDFRKTAARRLG